MKPIKLSFQAFGPYVERQEVDFTLLERAGLFLIRGETGAGKTFLLDAMTYALYGQSSGGARGDLLSMRCQLAGPSLPTAVSFEFEQDCRRYRFLRWLQPDGAAGFQLRQNVLSPDRDGVFQPLFEDPPAERVKGAAADLTGLTYEQFRQAVLLPQGQFERLLTADPVEKEALLSALFEIGQWDEAAERLHRRVRAEREALDALRQEKAALCQSVGCAQEGELAFKRQKLQERLGRLQNELDIVSREAELAARALEESAALQASFARLEAAEAAAIQLEAQEEAHQGLREILELQSLAEPYERWRRAVRDARLSRENVQFSRLAEADCVQKRKALDAEEQQALAQREILREKAERRPALEAELRLFDQRRSLAGESKSLRGQLSRKREEKARCERAYRACVRESSRAAALHLQILSRELAEGLEEGVPCPVCGSVFHPSPARPVAEEVTRERLQEVNERLRRADLLLARCTAECESLAEQLEAAEQRLERAGGYDAEAHLAAQNQGKAAAAAVHKLEAVEKRLSEFAELRSELRLKERTIQTSLKNGEKQLAQMEAIEEAVRWELDRRDPDGSARERLHRENPSAERFEQVKERLRVYDEQLAAARETVRLERKYLEGKERPDVNAQRIGLSRLQGRAGKLRGEAEACREQLARLHAAERQVQAINGTLDSRVEAHERLEEFSSLIRGESGSGVSLRRYLLGAMLSAVTAEANRLLERIHHGRYQIYRSLEAGGQKAGLELEVLDRQTGRRRGAGTLSGGEQFLAALALSLGLSAAAGLQGVGAIFIDEGFGSLDEQSLRDAMEALSAVRSYCGMVGIISHVGLLQEAVHAGIEVIKRPGGSELKLFL